jgi:hypothetical protein
MSLTAYQDLFALRAIEKAFVVYFPRADGASRRARVLIPPRLFTPGETKALAMTSQTAPDWQLQIGESGASSRYNFNMELERLVCKQTALAA